MSTILWLEKDLSGKSRRTKPVYAIVRFYARTSGFSKDLVDASTAEWVLADTLALIKADGPARAWVTFTAQPGVTERFARFSHSIFMVVRVDELSRAHYLLTERVKAPYNLTASTEFSDNDGHPIRIVTVY